MPQTLSHPMLRHPKFLTLVRSRRRYSLLLSAIVLGSYYAFMATVAFQPRWLATPLSTDSALTVGWPIGTGLIVGSWLLTGLYVRRANRDFDVLSRELAGESRQ
ncbi:MULTISPECIES: DUF485 domain-containing protein [Hydrocarboniphaga]|uniref:DUF485 domain-containing protein n=1 Tax=Hydrocarboniphaga effusa AP103 TaxID=1172194 RepID=I8I5T4_9GAMM|nr:MULTISPECIES: DUF485 domain-containing protein [Hydrocarboniphaga]EIT71926.1 hypothetical protein WQQ_20630 [Hydrocarboniphaga effusa AP103]MDZ4077370.1 DUF485 domain-containing protein [Hydrocarboniphaga sp.]